MVMKTITRRFAAWIACFAMLFGALAPSVSHALSAQRGSAWTEVCSANGVKMVQTMEGQGDPVQVDGENAAGHLDHCAFCATNPASATLLPGSARCIPVQPGRDTYPPLFFQSPSPLAVWTPAQSRAPPA